MVAPKPAPAFIALLAGAITGVAAWKDQCESFTASLSNVAFNTTYYPAGALVNLTSPSSTVSATKLPAFCVKALGLPRSNPHVMLISNTGLTLTITTDVTSGNQALTAVWMSDDWNNRL